MKKTDDTENLVEQYAAWRKVSEEMLADGMQGSIDCGEKKVREDFSRFAELPREITFEEMLVLERGYGAKQEILVEKNIDINDMVAVLENKNAKLIFDNGGGLTMQLDNEYAHYYNSGEIQQAAEDLVVYAKGTNLNEWEGHEPESLELDPECNDIMPKKLLA